MTAPVPSCFLRGWNPSCSLPAAVPAVVIRPLNKWTKGQRTGTHPEEVLSGLPWNEVFCTSHHNKSVFWCSLQKQVRKKLYWPGMLYKYKEFDLECILDNVLNIIVYTILDCFLVSKSASFIVFYLQEACGKMPQLELHSQINLVCSISQKLLFTIKVHLISETLNYFCVAAK